jgi:hypothetical protein
MQLAGMKTRRRATSRNMPSEIWKMDYTSYRDEPLSFGQALVVYRFG